MVFRRAGLCLSLILAATLFLSGCDSAEERAEAHYQSGLALLDAGDVDRAMVEFRNVFKLNGQHKEARLTYARLLRDRGQTEEAYGQYLRLIEQDPDNLEGRRALGEMALQNSDWDEAERHIRAAAELAEDDTLVAAMTAALDYRQAIVDSDEAAALRAVAKARAALDSDPSLFIARRVVIDQLLRDGDLTGALAETDAALVLAPEGLALHDIKLRVLTELGDNAGVGAHLQTMFRQFPEAPQVREALILWYIQSGDLAGAEAFLRQLGASDDRVTAEQARIGLVQLLHRTKGPAAARDELTRLIAAGGDIALYRSLRAAIDFEAGDTEGAIAEMEALVKDAPATETAHRMKAALAQMLEATGNPVGARAAVEQILAEDPAQVDALKMRAAWLTRDDNPGAAIIDLRRALDQDPRDPEILTLLAAAHLRDGSRELAGDRLSLAVEVSGQGAAESLRYAAFLGEDGRLAAAESVLIDALRRSDGDVDLLSALGDLYLRMPDWPRAEAVIAQLERIGGAAASDTATRLRLALLVRQQRLDESVALLQERDGQDAIALQAEADILRAHLGSGDLPRAAAYLDTLLADRPDDMRLRFLRAGVHVATGETAEAEAIYRALIASNPASDVPVQALFEMLRAQGRTQEALAVLDAGIESAGQTTPLMFLKATRLEAEGDIAGARAIYEALYARDSDNLVLVNNLASLIATHFDDSESLDRAFTIARRLRGTTVPPFQETYGWIEYRRGNFAEALVYLEPAAAELSEDPLAQLHLGLTYAALNRPGPARDSLERALELAGDNTLPIYARAREVLAGLPADAP